MVKKTHYLGLHILDIEDCIRRVHRSLVLCGLANEPLFVCERDEGRCRKAALLIGDCSGKC